MTDQRQPMPSNTQASVDAALKQAGVTPPAATDPGRIGPYQPLGLLGTGGMGRVYLARPSDGTPGLAAVKVIRPEYADDPRFRRRFEREAALHGRVRTIRAPRLLGTGFDDSLLWMATQYLPGLNLADAVRACGPLEVAGLWRLVSDLGHALSALAVAGIVHRDLKPSNVVLSHQGAHVIDFGIAQATDSSAITSTGSRVGTPAFMAPEHLREGRCDIASDVFSLAGSLVYAATGRAPFGEGTGFDVMHRVASEDPAPGVMARLAARDAGLAALLSACLSKDPAGRPTPRELTEAAAAAEGTGDGDHSPFWHEPLGGRLLARRQACEVLERSVVRAAVQETGRLREPARGPAVPSISLTQGPARESGAGGRRRKVYLALAAGLAACTLIAGTFFLTRPSVGGTASAAPPAASGTAHRDARTSLPPDSTAAPSGARDGDSEKTESGEKEDAASRAGRDEAGTDETSPAPRTTGDEATPTASRDGEGGGGDVPTASPTGTATTPAGSPWNARCTYYSGSEPTERGDKGRRVVQVQCMLTQRGFTIGGRGTDGRFGGATQAAVKRFQRVKGLTPNGVVGPDTWAALRSST
ncbi:protein kinase [Streptomyces sp. NPDC007984]|uniref:protein kinase domain-containing protein n=1 Tax=Streptomyces sp. NPDC007984 TaxID=3364801 RepID=UPI0036EF8577